MPGNKASLSIDARRLKVTLRWTAPTRLFLRSAVSVTFAAGKPITAGSSRTTASVARQVHELRILDGSRTKLSSQTPTWGKTTPYALNIERR
jgi:hypothetical protein